MRCVVLLLALLLSAAPVAAQAPVSSASREAVLEAARNRKIEVIRITAEPPDIDGDLSDPAWKQAVFVSDFLDKDPNEGAVAAERTDVGVLYDDDALYVGARMYCADPLRHIRASVSRRDNVGNSERFILTLDTYHDRRTAYSFAVTATGTRADYYHPTDNEYERDYSWDPVWTARTRIDSLGWTAEMRIPFSQLRFRRADDQVWGINYNRYVSSESEDAFLVYVPKNVSAWSSWFPELVGLKGITPSRRLEVVPYAAADGRFEKQLAGDPFHDGSEIDTRFGGDVKLGLGPNLTLDATINPDFGQVEADPAEVNLTAFETFFSERRPFFTEGAQLLAGDGPGYFYSRRIGAPPHRRIDTGDPVQADGHSSSLTADFQSAPNNSTILGAAKITGRLNSGLSIGFLSAATARERAVVFDSTLRTRGSTVVEPLTFYGVTRVQQEFGAAGSTVGVTLTGARRDITAGDRLADLLNRDAFTGGADWNLRFDQGTYELRGSAGFSRIAGDSGAIALAQRSSRRYFQRPDADYVEYDPRRTSLAGYEGSLSFEKENGRRWLWEIGGGVESPGFELNDLGSLTAADNITTEAGITYRVNDAGPVFRNHSSSIAAAGKWDFGSARQSATLNYGFSGQLRNFMNVSAGLGGWGTALDHSITRGGPLMRTGRGVSVDGSVGGNHAANFFWEAAGSYSRNELGGWGWAVGGQAQLRTGGRWDLSLNPSYQRTRPVRQYVTTLDRPDPAGPTFGRRYLFSYLESSTLALQLRLNYSFTPDLTLELYAEPFASSGAFTRFGEMAAPATSVIRYYGDAAGTTVTPVAGQPGTFKVTDGGETFTFTRPDFNVLSFRSNLVLRWQWSPGSTLFLVWQENRSDDLSSGRLVTPGKLLDSVSAPGENYIAAKITYWLPVR